MVVVPTDAYGTGVENELQGSGDVLVATTLQKESGELHVIWMLTPEVCAVDHESAMESPEAIREDEAVKLETDGSGVTTMPATVPVTVIA
jgi:hypothetical protein